jgi:DEAD/DEAH box helicase domain-containing protein
VDETIAWLRDRPYYDGQIRAERTVPGHDATFGDVDVDIAPRLQSALGDRGIDRLYGHQAEAIEAVRGGEHVVLATPTASGKSLAYTVPAFERAMDGRWGGGTPDDAASDGSGTALYVAPQVALINDQAETLSDLASDLGFASGVRVDQYTGRLSQSEKEAVRERQPTVLLTTPDMLHYGILPHAHRLWDWFFERLETVVVDEVHEYRGVFGSQVALLFRRMARVAERFDADPQWVCCSATIGNPVEHAATVTGGEQSRFRLIDGDDSATGPTHWLVWNPPENGGGMGRRRSHHVETKQLFVDLVSRGLQTLVFTPSRQTAERYATDSAEALRERGEHDLAAGVTAYQAALTDDRRREIEDGLHDGSIPGVWSTNALELGVDVGGLDAVLLDGYPGTRMATFQQGGRAGRGTDPSLVALVTGEDQLDQYVANQPETIFGGDTEQALANPENDHLMPDHVRAAARENWLSPEDDRHFGPTFPDVVADLEETGGLERRTTDKGVRWTTDGSPHHEMGLRTIDDREVKLRERSSGEVISSLGFADALRDVHPGAIYHHQGRTYEVVELDLRANVAVLERTRADYYTRVLHDKEITVEADHQRRELDAPVDVPVRFADVTMRKQITGFERTDARSGETIAREGLDLPETTLETTAMYYTLPAGLTGELQALGDFPGGIHAAEHAMISLFPLSFLCDRRDIGGLSTPVHPHTERPTIFIYDGYPGGVGLTEAAFDTFEALTERTHEMLLSCDCDDGCPACVQSPHCGNANDPLDKAVATELLGTLRSE